MLAGILAIAVASAAALAVAKPAAGDQHIRGLVGFDRNQFPEGLSVAADGTIFVGIFNTGRIYSITPEGDVSIFAHVPVPEGGFMAGLLTRDDGGVYALVFGGESPSSVWLAGVDGSAAQVADLGAGSLPNGAVMVGDRLLVTETIGGKVLSVAEDGSVSEWAVDELLLGNVAEPGPLGLPVGANGIALSPEGDKVYVTVFEMARIVSFPIEEDGSAGEISIVAEDPSLGGADGLTTDASGRLIVAVAPLNQIVAVDPETGSAAVVASGPIFRFPATVRFSPDFSVLYVTNFDGFVAFGLAEGPSNTSLLAIDAAALTPSTPTISPPTTGEAGLLTRGEKGRSGLVFLLAVVAVLGAPLAARALSQEQR